MPATFTDQSTGGVRTMIAPEPHPGTGTLPVMRGGVGQRTRIPWTLVIIGALILLGGRK